MSAPDESGPSVAADSGDLESCPSRSATRGVEVIPGSRVSPHRAGEHRHRDQPVSGSARPPDDRWRDAVGIPPPVGAIVEQTMVDTELGALRSRLGKQGLVLRRSATRLVVRFEGETVLARIRPALLRVLGDGPR